MGIFFLNYRQAKMMMMINMFWEQKRQQGRENGLSDTELLAQKFFGRGALGASSAFLLVDWWFKECWSMQAALHADRMAAVGIDKSQHWLYASAKLRIENKKAEGEDRREPQSCD